MPRDLNYDIVMAKALNNMEGDVSPAQFELQCVLRYLTLARPAPSRARVPAFDVAVDCQIECNCTPHWQGTRHKLPLQSVICFPYLYLPFLVRLLHAADWN